MRKIDVIILTVGAIMTIVWVVFSGKDGFKGSNATIVARSFSVAATMDGQVENDPPAVGERINTNDLLARIHNSRFDRGRLIEFESQIEYLEAEIANLRAQQTSLEALQQEFAERAASHANWTIGDAKLKHKEFAAQHDVAKARKRLEDEEVERAQQLFSRQLTSEVEMQIEKTQAEIAGAQVELNQAQLDRSALILQTMAHAGTFFENGDTSYWDKMNDTLSIRVFDNLNRIAMAQSQLTQARTQAAAEGARIDTSFAEEHRAPFDGMVSATFVTQGTRVTSGMDLLQIRDCTKPIVIIPIPNNRILEFAVGMKVSVYPIDSEQELAGRIEYISSAPILRSDTSIQVQQDITVDGNRAIVSLDGDQRIEEALQSCETTRTAVVVIHTNSLFETLTSWI